jgi:flagellar biosynthesis chaperone FliJ
VLNNEQIVQIIQKQQEQLQHFAKMLEDKDKIISSLESQLEVYKIMNEKNNSIIQLLQKNQ